MSQPTQVDLLSAGIEKLLRSKEQAAGKAHEERTATTSITDQKLPPTTATTQDGQTSSRDSRNGTRRTRRRDRNLAQSNSSGIPPPPPANPSSTSAPPSGPNHLSHHRTTAGPPRTAAMAYAPDDYTGPKTRAQTRSQGLPAPICRPQPPLQSYSQVNSGDGLIGRTVKVTNGPHKGLLGLVKSTTANGADVVLHVKGRAIVFSKQHLVVSDTAQESDARMLEYLAAQHLDSDSHARSRGSQLSMARGQSSPEKRAKAFVAPSQAASMRSSGEAKVYSLARPQPHPIYLCATLRPPSVLNISRPLLVVLDLNGTLLYRKNKGASFLPRPHLDEFLEYLFSNHVVMVWSSARQNNVNGMCSQFLSPSQFQRVAAIWSRDHLRLSQEAYYANTQVYKQLSWVWANQTIQAKNPVPNAYWDQSNTVLLDDSVEKSASEPFNLIRIDEFEARPNQVSEDVLPQVALYLNTLRSQRDVSSYIRHSPFLHDSSMPRAAVEAFAVARRAALSQSS